MNYQSLGEICAEPGQVRYRCGQCGKIHCGLPDITFDAPSYYYFIPPAERARRCHLTADTCVVDQKSFFIRAVLEVPIRGFDERFGWGVWCSVSETDFRTYEETFDLARQSRFGPFFGWFANRLPGYDDTLNLICGLILQDAGARPNMRVEPGSHRLSLEQRDGMAFDNAMKLASRAGAKLLLG